KKLNGIYLIPASLYGPGDNFDPKSSHVISGFIQKCIFARQKGEDTVTAWGSGSPIREFMYVDDAVDALLIAADRYNEPEPLNIGTGAETSIRELIQKIQLATAYEGRIVWDASKPDGQMRRSLDPARCRRLLGFQPRVSLDEGLRRTV